MEMMFVLSAIACLIVGVLISIILCVNITGFDPGKIPQKAVAAALASEVILLMFAYFCARTFS